jgi:hypothetical protein
MISTCCTIIWADNHTVTYLAEPGGPRACTASFTPRMRQSEGRYSRDDTPNDTPSDQPYIAAAHMMQHADAIVKETECECLGNDSGEDGGGEEGARAWLRQSYRLNLILVQHSLLEGLLLGSVMLGFSLGLHRSKSSGYNADDACG